MSVFNVPGLNIFFTSVEVRFWAAYSLAKPWSDRIVTPYPVAGLIWTHGWPDYLPRMRAWLGPRSVRQPAELSYTVNMRPPREHTWGIDKYQLKADMYGIYAPLFQQQGEIVRKEQDYQVRDLLFGLNDYSGTDRQLGTDGVSHWNTAHPVDPYDAGKGTYCNDYRGGVTINSQTVGGALSINAFNTMYGDFGLRKSNNGEALGVWPDLCMGSPVLKGEFTAILNNKFMSPAQFGQMGIGPVGTPNGPFVGVMNNVLEGWTDHVIVEDFGISTSIQRDWLMLCTSKTGIRPFSFGTFQAPQLVARTAPTDPAVFDSAQYLYGADAMQQPAFAPPWLSSRSGPTAA